MGLKRSLARHPGRPLRYSDGFTLVELLVGVALGVLTVSAALFFFASNKQHFLVQLEATRLQENQRLVAQFLARDIRGAGYRGCAGSDGPLSNLLNNAGALENNFRTAIEGFDNVSETLPGPLASALAGTSRVPIAGTDVLVVRGPEGDASGVRKKNTSEQVFLVVRSRKTRGCSGGITRINGICPGDRLLISDCQKARIFQVGSIDDSGAITHPAGGLHPGNSDGTWGGAAAPPSERFDTTAEIIRYGTSVYYIADNPGGDPALYRKTIGKPTEELVEGIADMQILYGTTADGTPAGYVPAAGVTDWDQVIAVRIWVLLRGFEDRMAEAEQTYLDSGGTLVTAPDRRLYRTLLSTIGLRNRLP